MMKQMNMQIAIPMTVLGAVLSFVPVARAQGASEAIYKSKCAACHGPDGSGSAMGKKLGARDFHSAYVQKQSDSDLSGIIAKGEGKMPGYDKTLKADEIAGLVAYIRSLAPAK
jgi:cytochrome c6